MTSFLQLRLKRILWLIYEFFQHLTRFKQLNESFKIPPNYGKQQQQKSHPCWSQVQHSTALNVAEVNNKSG